MSTLPNIAKVCLIASVDLFSGTLFSYFTNRIFREHFPIDEEKFTPSELAQKRLFYSVLQISATILIGESFRSSIFPEGFNDPTGGAIFSMALLRQPVVFERMEGVMGYLNEYLKQNFFLPQEFVPSQ